MRIDGKIIELVNKLNLCKKEFIESNDKITIKYYYNDELVAIRELLLDNGKVVEVGELNILKNF